MSLVYRFMRLMVFFDLPTLTSAELRDYNRFRKFLIKNGFVMLQESVYSRIVLNNTSGEAVREAVRKNKTKSGNIQMLTISERQFANIEYICGKKQTEIIDTDERLVVL